MERAPPDWLNREFLTEALEKEDERQGKVIVTEFTIKTGSAVGDNYTSYMFRINVTFKEGSSNEEKEEMLIVKAPIVTGIIKDLIDKWDVEPIIYNNVLPKMYKKLKIHLGPKSYHSIVRSALVLKDLKADGFVVCDRFNQLDFAHCKLVCETIAKYHAASVALHHEEPELIDKIGEERNFVGDSEYTGIFKTWMNSSLGRFVEVVKKLGGQKAVIDFLQSKVDNFWDLMVQFCKQKPNTVNVLNHGDCWTNNMMFKHNSDGEVVDIKLIDFQLPKYNSPALDIVQFLWTSAKEDVRRNQQNKLFEVYLHTLNKTLEELGCEERLTFEELEEDLRSATDHLLWIVSFVHLFTFCEPELAIDMGKYSAEDFSSGVVDAKCKPIYDGKRYKALLPGIVGDLQTWLTSRGLVSS